VLCGQRQTGLSEQQGEGNCVCVCVCVCEGTAGGVLWVEVQSRGSIFTTARPYYKNTLMTSQKTTNTSSTQTSVLKIDYEYVKKSKGKMFGLVKIKI